MLLCWIKNKIGEHSLYDELKNYIFKIIAVSAWGQWVFEDYRKQRDMGCSENLYVYGLQIKNLNWKHDVIFCFKHMVFISCGINTPKCLKSETSHKRVIVFIFINT